MRLLITVLFFYAFSSLFAQDISSTTSGFSLEIGGQYAGWSSNSNFISDLAELDPDGYGYRLGIGDGFSEKLNLRLVYNSINFNLNDNWTKFGVTGLDAYGQINFGGTLQKFRPFLGAGLSTRSMKVDPVTLDLGFFGTGGANYHFLPNLAVAFQLSFISGGFSENTISGEQVDVDETVDFTIIAFSLSVNYYFEY